MAKGARQHGVEIYRKAQVDGYRWTGSEWIVSGTIMAERGNSLIASEETFEIRAEHVVTATGNHAQRTADLLGISMPAIPVEHQYIVTEPDPALVEWRKENGEHPVLRDADAKWYVREERGGWILGPYERNAPARFIHGVPRELPRGPVRTGSRADRDRVHVDDPPNSVVGNRGAEGTISHGPICYNAGWQSAVWGRRRDCATCGWPRASVSASPPRAAPVTTWPR